MKNGTFWGIMVFLWILIIFMVYYTWGDVTSVSRFNRKQEMELRYLQIQKLELEVRLLQHELNNKQP